MNGEKVNLTDFRADTKKFFDQAFKCRVIITRKDETYVLMRYENYVLDVDKNKSEKP